MASRKRQLDSRIEVVTPENIAFEYRVAGPFLRLPAYLMDVGLRFAMVVILSLILSLGFGMAGLFGMGVGLSLIAWFALSWFYGGLFETLWNGQTPGKRLFRLRVVSVDGQPVNALQAVLRNVLRSVDGLPAVLEPLSMLTYQVGLLTSMMNDRMQRLGDLACGTMVIVEDRERLAEVARFDKPEVFARAATLPANFVVSASLARTLAMYVERRGRFGPLRRAEIARPLGRVLVERFALPADTSDDLLICALYHRAFVTDRAAEEELSFGGASPIIFGQLIEPPAETELVPAAVMPDRLQTD